MKEKYIVASIEIIEIKENEILSTSNTYYDDSAMAEVDGYDWFGIIIN